MERLYRKYKKIYLRLKNKFGTDMTDANLTNAALAAFPHDQKPRQNSNIYRIGVSKKKTHLFLMTTIICAIVLRGL